MKKSGNGSAKTMWYRWIVRILGYGAGVLLWFIVFGCLRYHCVFNIDSTVDALWLKRLHGNLVENVAGKVALHVSNDSCGDTYLYTANYHPSRMDATGEVVSLDSLIDVPSWRMIEADSVTVTYLDSKHRYVLHTTSDGEYLQAVNR